MGDLTIYKDEDRGNTLVSNCFIDYYLADANDAQIKIYLYLLRMLSVNKAISIGDIADQFNHTEKDVCRALHYWETKGLLSLDYDSTATITGVHLIPPRPPREEPSSGFVPFVTLMPAIPTTNHSSSSTETRESSHSTEEPQTEVYTQNKKETDKARYSLEDLQNFQQDEKAKEVICIAEQYLQKTLNGDEIRSLYFIMDSLHFSIDLIDYLLQYCVKINKTGFHFIEKVAQTWAEKDITTEEDARIYSMNYDKRVYTILNALGEKGNPAPAQTKVFDRWLNEYQFSMDLILDACNRSALHSSNNRIQYADGILSKWHEKNIHNLEEVAKADADYQKNNHPNNSQKSAIATSFLTGDDFHDFARTDYDFDALEERLLNKK